jgi:hypothetical protein
MSPFCPGVEDVGLDPEPAGGLGDAELTAGLQGGVGGGVLLAGAGSAVAAGGTADAAPGPRRSPPSQ